jgi:hypothetical protein
MVGVVMNSQKVIIKDRNISLDGTFLSRAHYDNEIHSSEQQEQT